MKLSAKKNLLLATLGMLITQQSSHASLIAILDSGSDLTHPDLAPKAWVNTLDDSKLGYSDDIHGWNFLKNSSELVDLSLVNKFSPDIYEYFNVQARLMDGTDDATLNPEGRKADIQWYKDHTKGNKDFMAQLNEFGDFAHGTNVAGIAAKGNDQAQIMGITEIGKADPAVAKAEPKRENNPRSPGETHAQRYLDILFGDPKTSLESTNSKIGQYLNRHGAQVANCSFGNSKAQVLKIVKIIEFFAKPIHGKKFTIANYEYVMNHMMKADRELFDASPNTLFLVAAGNDSSDNDVYFTTPANIKTDHSMVVAATSGHKKLASFSNYGKTTVDVAAPGVGILSDSPGGKQVRMSGTSQATPYVTNIAARCLDANKTLAPKDVKAIIMGTVDKKDFLKGKVVSEGIVNMDRAVRAASLSNSMPIDQAVAQAGSEIADVVDPAMLAADEMEEFTTVAPLKSELEFR